MYLPLEIKKNLRKGINEVQFYKIKFTRIDLIFYHILSFLFLQK